MHGLASVRQAYVTTFPRSRFLVCTVGLSMVGLDVRRVDEHRLRVCARGRFKLFRQCGRVIVTGVSCAHRR